MVIREEKLYYPLPNNALVLGLYSSDAFICVAAVLFERPFERLCRSENSLVYGSWKLKFRKKFEFLPTQVQINFPFTKHTTYVEAGSKSIQRPARLPLANNSTAGTLVLADGAYDIYIYGTIRMICLDTISACSDWLGCEVELKEPLLHCKLDAQQTGVLLLTSFA